MHDMENLLIMHLSNHGWWEGGKHMTAVCLTIQGTLTTESISNVILTLQMIEIEKFWDGILAVKANDRKWILTDKPFIHQNPWFSLPPPLLPS